MNKNKTKLEKVLKRTHRHEHIVYLEAFEYKTNKYLLINTRRILYVKSFTDTSSLIMMNSGYRIKVNGSFADISKKLHKDLVNEEYIEVDVKKLIATSNTKRAREIKKKVGI